MNMKSCVAIAVFVVALPGIAWGHGFTLSLAGNNLGTTSNDYPGNGNPLLFGAEFEDVGGDLQSDHGGAGTSLFGTGKSLSFEVLGPLWFSKGDGSLAVPARDGLSLEGDGNKAGFPGSIEIDGSSTLTNGFLISGNTSHEFLWTLLVDAGFDADDEGVYGIIYRVKGSPTGGSPYTPTPWMVSTWMTLNFNPGADPLAADSPFRVAQDAIFNAAAATAVPEPSSLVLAAVGAAMLLMAQKRRNR